MFVRINKYLLLHESCWRIIHLFTVAPFTHFYFHKMWDALSHILLDKENLKWHFIVTVDQVRSLDFPSHHIKAITAAG